MYAEKSLGDNSHGSIEPPVSVILTVVNEAAHLEEAVKAVLQSDFTGVIEIAIAVGPSKDKTREIASELARIDKRIKVIDNPSGRTPEGLNAALSATTNEIIVRVDGHSAIQPNYIRGIHALDGTSFSYLSQIDCWQIAPDRKTRLGPGA